MTETHERRSASGEVGKNWPKWVVEREVAVSSLRRLIDRSVRASEARSSERKDAPSSKWRRWRRRLEATFKRTRALASRLTWKMR